MTFHGLALGALSILTAVGIVSAQNADGIECLSTFSWMTNTLGQNPCVIASFLEGACFDVTFTIAPLPTGTHYVGPVSSGAANDCICSSVVYSLTSACDLCQGGIQISKWSTWITNCSQAEVDAAGYPKPIPAGTAVPNWAYQSVTAEDTFDVNIAHNDSISNPSESSAAVSGPTGSSSPSSSSSPPIGAIVGGVVGGLFGVGLVVILAVYFVLKRRRGRVAPTSQMAQVPVPSPSPFAPSPFRPDTAAASTAGGTFLPPTTKLYDPNDPSTFPSSPAPATYLSHSPAPTGPGFVSTPGSPPPFQPVRGQYSGAPEV